jgi:cation diffusion facilitator CzcD-associated flavoprotein CzcO
MSGASANGGGPRHARVGIVGAGFSGIGMAARLRRDGIDDFFILERSDELGGTWRDNTYPGCQCDIPSPLYSFSFAPNPEWTRMFALQPEIRDYLHRVADDHRVVPHIRFGHEVHGAGWDSEAKRWRLETSQGPFSADVLVGAMGGLSEPARPEIPGLDDFEGAVFHSAQWDHDHDLAGERVAVIGTGASAVQLVPEIQPLVERLHLFQRTPVWVMPNADRPMTEFERRLFRRVPAAQRGLRTLIYLIQEGTVVGTIFNRRLLELFQRIAQRHLERQVPDPELRAKLTPSYTLGCKRITMSDTYFPALTRPNAEVVTEPIAEVTERGIRTADGDLRELDTIILATGFRVLNNPGFAAIRGRDGRSLLETWGGSPRAYLGTTVPNFPNLFFLVGPNSAGGFNSIIFTSESHINYVAQCLREMDRAGVAAVEVRPEVFEAFSRETEERLAESVWNAGGCASWYLDANGRNCVWWPDFMWRLWQRTRRFDRGSYRAELAAA